MFIAVENNMGRLDGRAERKESLGTEAFEVRYRRTADRHGHRGAGDLTQKLVDRACVRVLCESRSRHVELGCLIKAFRLDETLPPARPPVEPLGMERALRDDRLTMVPLFLSVIPGITALQQSRQPLRLTSISLFRCRTASVRNPLR